MEKVKGRAVKKLCQEKSRWKIKIEVVQETSSCEKKLES